MIEQQNKQKQLKKAKIMRLTAQQEQNQFEIKEFIGRGTFGTVHQAYWKTKKMNVAIKSIAKNTKFKSREVEILNLLQHQSIVSLLMCYEKVEESSKIKKGQKEKIYTNLVMQYVPKTLLSYVRLSNKNSKLTYDIVVDYARKLLLGLQHLEENNICHRDIKPSNVLIDETDGRVKICDFGSAKQLKKGQKSITYVCSRYYRAPELVLGCGEYSTKIDIWSAGCVIAQMVTLYPLFDGDDNIDQIAKIIKVLGLPTKQDLEAMKVENFNSDFQDVVAVGLTQKIRKWTTNCPQEFIDLLSKLIVYNPEKRLSAKQALKHPVFQA